MMGNGFGFGVPGLGMILVWLGIFAFVAWLVRTSAGTGETPRPGKRDSARQILEDRYARGEIDRSELERKGADLSA